MKRKWLLAVVLVVLVLCSVGVFLLWAERERATDAARGRQNVYESIVASYAAVWKHGTTRDEIETELKRRSVSFQNIAGGGLRGSGYATLVKIGQEPAPWFCSEKNIYVAFEFDEVNSTPGRKSDPSGNDRLLQVRLLPKLDTCL